MAADHTRESYMIRASRLQVLPSIRSSFWGFADQALISGTNFTLMLLIARQLGPKAYGAFVVTYTVLLFANSVQSALFTQPHNVLGATRTGPAYAHYTTSTGLAQAIFSCCAGLMIGMIAVGILAMGYQSGWMLLVLAPVCIVWQLQEFVRRVLYTQSDYCGAFLNDVVSYGGQFAGITLLWRLDRLSPVTALVVIGTGATAGLIVGVWQIRFVLKRTLDWPLVREELGENWKFGRWLLGGSLTSWISGQLYPLLTAGLVGIGAAGGMRAAQTIVAPTHIVIKSVDAVFISRSTRVYGEEGLVGLRTYVRKIALPIGAVLTIYCTLCSIFAEPLVGILLGAEYKPYAWLVRIFAISYVLGYLGTIASIILRSVGKTAPMFYAYACSAAIVLTVGVWAVFTFGMMGATVGMIMHVLVINVVLWWNVSTFFVEREGASLP